MPKSVHMICHCTGEGYRGYRALFEEGGGRFRSEAWLMDQSTADALKGGWTYFHEGANELSTSIWQIVDNRVRADGRMMLILKERVKPKNHRWSWRGPKADRWDEESWYSIVDNPAYPHEKAATSVTALSS